MPMAKLAPNVRTAFTQDGAVVMEIKKGLVYSSDPVVATMPELLLAGSKPYDVCSTIASREGLAVELVVGELNGLISVLEQSGVAEFDEEDKRWLGG